MIFPTRHTCLSLLVSVGAVLAQPRENPKLKAINSVGIEVDVRCGIANHVEEFLSMPVTMTVSNTTAESISAVWEVEFLDYANRQLRSVRKEVELPPNMKTSRRTRVYLKRQGSLTVVRLRRNREVLWQRIMRWESISRSAINILTVSPNRERLRFAARNDAAVGNMPGPGEREVRSYAIQSWELPTHSLPLCMFKAVVISKNADLSLSPAQERALTDYLVFGGSIVVPGGKSSVLELLNANLPQAAVDATQKASQMKMPAPTRIGSGMLFFDAKDFFLRTKISMDAATNLAKYLEYEAEPAFPKFMRPSNYVRRGLPVNASKTLSMVGVVFGLYAFLTGPVIWLILRKKGRKALAWYVGVTITIFCLIALFVGPILGLRKGDIQWLSVTELTPNGGYQWAMLSLTSAGGKSHHVELKGERLRSWLLPSTVTNDYRFSRYWWGFRQNLPLESSMNISMDLVNEDIQKDRHQVQISPWGTRLLLTNSYTSKAGQVDVRISHPNRKTRIVVTNRSKFALTDSRIIVSFWAKNQGQETYVIMNTGQFKPGSRREFGPDIINRQMGNWGVRNMFGFVRYHDWERNGGCTAVQLPRPNLNNTPNAYFIAKIPDSPALRMGQSNFDPNLGTHLVVQRIEPSNILNPQRLMNQKAGVR